MKKVATSFLIHSSRLNTEYGPGNWKTDLEYCQAQIQPILSLFPKNPIWVLSVFIGITRSQDEAESLIQQYSQYLDCPMRCQPVSLGVVCWRLFGKSAEWN